MTECNHEYGPLLCDRPAGHTDGFHTGPAGSSARAWWTEQGRIIDHPGCTCPMTGLDPWQHHDDCAAHL